MYIVVDNSAHMKNNSKIKYKIHNSSSNNDWWYRDTCIINPSGNYSSDIITGFLGQDHNGTKEFSCSAEYTGNLIGLVTYLNIYFFYYIIKTTQDYIENRCLTKYLQNPSCVYNLYLDLKNFDFLIVFLKHFYTTKTFLLWSYLPDI